MKKIVLIEDDADLFSLLKYNLEKEGFSLTGSQTGKGALDLCRRTRPDLILLDIMLPDSDGLDICKGIRNDSDLMNVPVIFLTARASETDRIVGLELGANDYICQAVFYSRVDRAHQAAVSVTGGSGARVEGRSGRVGSQQLPGALAWRIAVAHGDGIPAA